MSRFNVLLTLRLILTLAVAVPALGASVFTLDSATYTPIGCLSFLFPTPFFSSRQLSSHTHCLEKCTAANLPYAAWMDLQRGVLCTCGTSELFEDAGDEWETCTAEREREGEGWKVALNDGFADDADGTREAALLGIQGWNTPVSKLGEQGEGRNTRREQAPVAEARRVAMNKVSAKSREFDSRTSAKR